jgi:hypothetical protein
MMPLDLPLQSVLSSPVHTPLHDEALGVVSLHCGAGDDIPRSDTLALLYQTLGVIPAYRWVVEVGVGELVQLQMRLLLASRFCGGIISRYCNSSACIFLITKSLLHWFLMAGKPTCLPKSCFNTTPSLAGCHR